MRTNRMFSALGTSLTGRARFSSAKPAYSEGSGQMPKEKWGIFSPQSHSRNQEVSMRFPTRLVVPILTLVVTAVPTLLAQLPTGTILGQVKDASGAVVPMATVTVVNVETGQARTITTGNDGSYRAPALPVGRYTVKFEKTGFRTETQTGLVLEVAQELVMNTTLQVGATTQEVVVTGEAPLVNTTGSSLGGVVNEDKIADLPLNGRNYINLSLLQAGVTQSHPI